MHARTSSWTSLTLRLAAQERCANWPIYEDGQNVHQRPRQPGEDSVEELANSDGQSAPRGSLLPSGSSEVSRFCTCEHRRGNEPSHGEVTSPPTRSRVRPGGIAAAATSEQKRRGLAARAVPLARRLTVRGCADRRNLNAGLRPRGTARSELLKSIIVHLIEDTFRRPVPITERSYGAGPSPVQHGGD